MVAGSVHSPEDRRFVGLAGRVVDDILVRDPVHATSIGDHRFDGRLPDLSADGVEEYVRVLRRHQTSLDSVDTRALSRATGADLAILRAGVARRIFDLAQLREHEWNPLVWNPGPGLYLLLARDFASPPRRATVFVERLRQVPEFLDSARQALADMPVIHVRTAIAQLTNLASTLDGILGDVADQPGVSDAMTEAFAAVDRHVGWLSDQEPDARQSVAMGPELYAGVVAHHLESAADVDDLLAGAEDHLEQVLDELGSTAARYQRGTMADRTVIAKALQRLASAPESRVDDATVLDVCTDALESAAAFVRDRDLVTIPPLQVRLEAMPGAFRGISVAWCDAPGPLESVELPTVIAVAPTPDDWPTERKLSFYREYHRYLIDDLMVHEGLPGHALQLAHARRTLAPTPVRAVLPSAVFVEGWAVYAEEMMAHRGFPGSADDRLAIRIQQLKMQLRVIVNTILDIRVHTRGMTEAEARRLLATRGFAEEGEIVGKWDRARLTVGQLATYYLGYRGVAAVVDELDEDRRDWTLRQVHDAVLSHGSVPTAVLRSLVGLR